MVNRYADGFEIHWGLSSENHVEYTESEFRVPNIHFLCKSS